MTASGVFDIIRYNRGYYSVSISFIAAAALCLGTGVLPSPLCAGVAVVVAPAAFWTAASLFVSWFVYDHAAITRWHWLPGILRFPPCRWMQIHAGLDEASAILDCTFPDAQSVVLDIYDPTEMPEPSIARARRLHPPLRPPSSAILDALPAPGGACDTVFVLFTAHEIRDRVRRVIFFRELARVVSAHGQVLVAEHLRDWRNFLAFGPGFLHFYSRAEWLRVAREAGLVLEAEAALTPFARCFRFTGSA
jgi:hypothetical protein